jgi:hypothetical protein
VCGCCRGRTPRRLRQPAKCDPHPTNSCVRGRGFPSAAAVFASELLARAGCGVLPRSHRRRTMRRCRDRGPILAREDTQAANAVSTRARNIRSRRCSGRAEPQANTSGKARARSVPAGLLSGQPIRPALPVSYSQACSISPTRALHIPSLVPPDLRYAPWPCGSSLKPFDRS